MEPLSRNTYLWGGGALVGVITLVLLVRRAKAGTGEQEQAVAAPPPTKKIPKPGKKVAPRLHRSPGTPPRFDIRRLKPGGFRLPPRAPRKQASPWVADVQAVPPTQPPAPPVTQCPPGKVPVLAGPAGAEDTRVVCMTPAEKRTWIVRRKRHLEALRAARQVERELQKFSPLIFPTAQKPE